MIELIVNVIVLVLMPFLYVGIINRVKSFWAGRKGPSVLQPFYDFAKMMKKGEVISTTTSFIFRITPSLLLASTLSAALVTPIIRHKSILGFDGDFIFFIYMLGLGKFFSVLSAMDTGSSFEGMGATREVTFSSFIEPAFLIILSSLCLITGYTRFDDIFPQLTGNPDIVTLIAGLSVLVIFAMILVEGCRVPVDDPNTHLELTMIHEVMILDNSGPDLAFIQYASSAKMVILASLIPNLIIARGTSLLTWIILYLIIITVSAILIGLIESLMARLRLIHLPQFIFLLSSVSLVVLAAIIVYTYSFGGSL